MDVIASWECSLYISLSLSLSSLTSWAKDPNIFTKGIKEERDYFGDAVIIRGRMRERGRDAEGPFGELDLAETEINAEGGKKEVSAFLPPLPYHAQVPKQMPRLADARTKPLTWTPNFDLPR